jgi:hypothetical protein
MKTLQTIIISILAIAFLAAPIMAAGPTAKKQILKDDDGTSVLLISVTPGTNTVYSVIIDDPSGSIENIKAPKGWSAIASDDKALFLTTDKPVKSGSSVKLKIVTKDENAPLSLTFQDVKRRPIGEKKTI